MQFFSGAWSVSKPYLLKFRTCRILCETSPLSLCVENKVFRSNKLTMFGSVKRVLSGMFLLRLSIFFCSLRGFRSSEWFEILLRLRFCSMGMGYLFFEEGLIVRPGVVELCIPELVFLEGKFYLFFFGPLHFIPSKYTLNNF